MVLVRKVRPSAHNWGINVTRFVLKEIMPSPDVLKTLNDAKAAENEKIATQLRADADKYAKITEAKAKAEALQALFDVAKGIDEKTLNIKYLESLEKLGEGQSTKYILPLELINLLKSLAGTSASSAP